MTVQRGDAIGLLRELVRVDSRNPSLVPGAPGERAVAMQLADILRSWGMEAELRDALPGRPNVVATVGRGRGRSLIFNGHIDVVDVAGMTHDPFAAATNGGRLYGRGASDMKGGVAAMCAAAARVADSLDGTLTVTAVVDEEWESAGTSALLAAGLRADAAIVTEPTRLAIMPAHKGFVWLDVEVHGKAAHGSRWDIGVDAIAAAGLLLAEVDRLDRETLPRKREHPLLGRASIHAGTVSGGVGLSTYPDRCRFTLERRTLPGETVDDVRREIDELYAAARRIRPELTAHIVVTFSQPPSDVAADAPLVKELATAVNAAGFATTPRGMSAWTDAALLNDAGIPAICFGPGDMGLAHAAEEYIEEREVEVATNILADFAMNWCR